METVQSKKGDHVIGRLFLGDSGLRPNTLYLVVEYSTPDDTPSTVLRK